MTTLNDLVLEWTTPGDPSDSVQAFLCTAHNNSCSSVHYDGFRPLPSALRGRPSAWILPLPHSIWSYYDTLVLEAKSAAMTSPTAIMRVGVASLATSNATIPWIGTTVISTSPSSAELASVSHFPHVQYPFFAYHLIVTSDADLIVQQQVGPDVKYHFVSGNQQQTLDIHFHQQYTSRSAALDHLVLTIWLPAATEPPSWAATIAIDWYGSLGMWVLRFAPLMPMSLYVIAWICLVYHWTHTPTELSVYRGRAGGVKMLGAWLEQDAPQLGLVVVMTYLQIMQTADFEGLTLWIFALLVSGLVVGLTLGVFVTLCFLAQCLTWLTSGIWLSKPPPPEASTPTSRSSASSIFGVSILVALVSLLRYLPSSVVLCLIYFFWVGVCATSYRKYSQKMDIASYQKYIHRSALLNFLTAWLLVFEVPQVVIHARDLIAVGWQFHPSLATLVHDIPYMFGMMLLLAFGNNEDLSR
ncbi:hypothetical protein DM01DRAFT_309832 [Hesseltinella vesiculosa]|uniref:Uncharacterized protein n=1 Tax=Hesseltinella vesiculosa TaxID=101127 RepID=A0A1X2GL52_9FUNG|nr:hypothetical protein DM01DRAFT_309832 [Hesseltinella vesiculosa]